MTQPQISREYWLYERLKQENPGANPQFSFTATCNWLRAIALLCEINSFEKTRLSKFYDSVQRRSINKTADTLVFEQAFMSFHNLAALEAIKINQNYHCNLIQSAIINWYYGIYFAASAMITACDGSYPQDHTSTANAWTQHFAITKKIVYPFNLYLPTNDSFTLDGTIKVVDHFKIQVPKIGILRTYERLPQGYKPKNVTISRKANSWFISYKIEIEPKPTIKTIGKVGVDLGVKTLAYLSTGIVFEGAKAYKRYEKRLSRLQWLNRNKVIGSNNWKKAQLTIAKLHAKIANVRKDTLHKLTTYLAKNHGAIAIEDLNVSGMLKNGKLAKAIADMGFYEFRRQLEYKCQLYGSKLIIADRFFPSSKTCSNCGWHNPNLKLSDRWFLCVGCGSFIERDWNASINLSRWSHCQT